MLEKFGVVAHPVKLNPKISEFIEAVKKVFHLEFISELLNGVFIGGETFLPGCSNYLGISLNDGDVSGKVEVNLDIENFYDAFKVSGDGRTNTPSVFMRITLDKSVEIADFKSTAADAEAELADLFRRHENVRGNCTALAISAVNYLESIGYHCWYVNSGETFIRCFYEKENTDYGKIDVFLDFSPLILLNSKLGEV